jgi:DNA invertase Pin-like site-specific DNA recombinase
MPKRAAFYLRVSTGEQTTENQRIDLERIARKAEWNVAAIYEEAVSGAKGRADRPEYDRMLRDATRREFDIVAAWSVDRLGRSLQDLLAFLNELQKLGIDLYLHQQALDTRTPAGRAMFGMCGVFAEFERALIRERVIAGQKRARENGKRIGRTPHGPDMEAEVWRLRAAKTGKCKIARTLGIGTAAVQRILATTKPPPKTALVTLFLRVENNSKWVRGRKKALEKIECYHLAQYDMEKLPNSNYRLRIPFKNDVDLDNTIYELLRDIESEADYRHCFIEADVYENGTDRHW